jgi:fucose permease
MRNQVNTGAYLSILNAMASIAAGIMPPIAGTIIDSLGYGMLFIAVALSTIISAISLLIYSKKIDKQRKLNG